MAMITRRDAVAGLAAAGALAAMPLQAQDGANTPFDIPGSYGKVSPWFKRTSFMNRLPTVTPATFESEWLVKHGPMMAKLPGLQKLALGLVDHKELPNVPFDAITEFFYQSEAAHDASYRDRDPALSKALDEHARTLLTPNMRLFTREIVFREFANGKPPPGAVKRIGLVRRKPEWKREAFLKDWRDVHAPELEGMKGMIRYTINVQIPRLNPDTPYDGYAEIWWDSHANYLAATAERARQRAAEEAKGKLGPSLPALLAYVKPSTPLWR